MTMMSRDVIVMHDVNVVEFTSRHIHENDVTTHTYQYREYVVTSRHASRVEYLRIDDVIRQVAVFAVLGQCVDETTCGVRAHVSVHGGHVVGVKQVHERRTREDLLSYDLAMLRQLPEVARDAIFFRIFPCSRKTRI